MVPTSLDDPLDDPLDGVTTVPVVPFDEHDRLDLDVFGAHVDRLRASGVASFVVGGHTGEFHSLTAAEAAQVTATAATVLGPAAARQLLVGVGRDLPSACSAAAATAALGCRGVVVHQPPHPGVSPAGYRDYVTAVAASTDGDIVIYLTDASLISALPELLELERLVGVKWGIPQPELWRLARTQAASAGSRARFVCGLAERWAVDYCDEDAPGFTSGIANIHPALSLGYARNRTFSVDERAGVDLFESMRFRDHGRLAVGAVKALLELTVGTPARVRPPVVLPNPAELTELRTVLDMWGLAGHTADLAESEPQ